MMPRKARIDAPGALHHVIIRGIERRKIFRSDYDRQNFITRLAELIPESKVDCYAWALLFTVIFFKNWFTPAFRVHEPAFDRICGLVQ